MINTPTHLSHFYPKFLSLDETLTQEAAYACDYSTHMCKDQVKTHLPQNVGVSYNIAAVCSGFPDH